MLDRAARLLRRPFAPLLDLRLLNRTVRFRDPWERFACDVPLHRFGSGARHDFPWYFEGESIVEAPTVEAAVRWLRTCRYTRDPDLFREADFWQHPCTFEQLRRGDCEDFALWTWRRLVELGHEADLVAGRSTACVGEGAHAWVVFRDAAGTRRLFDPVAPGAVIRPLAEARADYCPEVAVDGRFRRYAYAGYYLGRATA